jgi:hypothetical protein
MAAVIGSVAPPWLLSSVIGSVVQPQFSTVEIINES